MKVSIKKEEEQRGKMITINQLRFFLAVIQERGFSRAAEKCEVSQSSVSLAIKRLEFEMGTSLLERSKTHIKATPTGLQILPHVRKVLFHANKIKNIARGVKCRSAELGIKNKLNLVGERERKFLSYFKDDEIDKINILFSNIAKNERDKIQSVG